ncbi:response regulator transcription factor [Metabacillus litoralis]|uniref:response regulator transcription factor n=1 Tax=Metabacillus TaxID=2675233 RepID=UPI001BA11FAB|nr:response regulator transcription factor [Metabacillus litoralis]MCM3411395.1 response regulator transcription factor [Metabacillus litoralis]UHA60454.1 response regulator transcription factor [Metabacillus litoralis]
MTTVLLIDDEQRMLNLLSLYLEPYGYICFKKNSGPQGIETLRNQKVDIVILDIMMPEMDGWTTCERIREISDVPIIMLTARSEKEDIVKGLKKGADDYLVKPFNEEELLARIEAIMRRTNMTSKSENIIRFEELLINQSTYQVTFQEKEIVLTPKEYALLSLFLENQNKVFSREHLLTTIWGLKAETEDRTIDSHIRNMREKLRQANFPVEHYLKTVWGVGYKWVSSY